MTPPVIDGKDDDAIWRTAPPITAFKQWQPTEGKEPRFQNRGEGSLRRGESYMCSCARSIRTRTASSSSSSGRDSFTPSDMVWVFVDSYHDRRSGYEFGVNAAGVKLDQAVSNGGKRGRGVDAVWTLRRESIHSAGPPNSGSLVRRCVTSRGPRAHLRLNDRSGHLQYAERVSLPMLSQSKPDLVSQLGTLDGMDDLEAPRKLEVMPYVVTKSASQITNNSYGQQGKVTVGGDVNNRVASNLTLDATINPDFGQVESDPSVLKPVLVRVVLR